MNNMTQREIYEQKVSAQFEIWGAEIDKLEARLKKAGLDTRSEVKEKMDSLENQRQSVREKFEELKSASDDAWSDVKKGLDNAWEALSGSVDSARKQFH